MTSDRNYAAEYRVQKQRDDQVNERVREIEQTQSCARGEHMLVTGRRTCPLCGGEL